MLNLLIAILLFPVFVALVLTGSYVMMRLLPVLIGPIFDRLDKIFEEKA